MAEPFKIKDLKTNDIVVFKVNPYGDMEYTMDGNVVSVNEKTKLVACSYLLGFKSMIDDIPFKDMLAKYAPEDGEDMKFDNISGMSRLLEE